MTNDELDSYLQGLVSDLDETYNVHAGIVEALRTYKQAQLAARERLKGDLSAVLGIGVTRRRATVDPQTAAMMRSMEAAGRA